LKSYDAEETNPCWYVIQTKARAEGQAAQNLRAWQVETYAPLVRQARYNEFSGEAVRYVKPLFARYIFARFDARQMLHKISYTRGVQGVIRFNSLPVSIDPEAIEVIREREDAEGYVQLNESRTVEDNLQRGEAVRVCTGALEGLEGVFDQHLKDKERVMVFLTSANYQARMQLERRQVVRA
jgi:transcription elongation factor/antiterminator RfaH